jgi:hypothetical protein
VVSRQRPPDASVELHGYRIVAPGNSSWGE